MKTYCWLSIMIVMVLLLYGPGLSKQNRKRDRGEMFYNCYNSNTPGPGDIWISLIGVGHIWDDSPILTDTAQSSSGQRRWISNVRAFPEMKLSAGITDFFSVHAASRPLSWSFRPGFFGGGIKLTSPDNKELRLHGFGLSVDGNYITRESGPSLGGYIGFMPEGFVVKGGNIETKLLYELDLLTKMSGVPVRVLMNTGIRYQLSKRKELSQFLADITVVYSSYQYDFYAGYSLESFTNFFSPIMISQEGDKKFPVWFKENPMYLNLGGNYRCDNGVTLSITVPLLLSVNEGSRMRLEDLIELHRQTQSGRFTYEKERGIRDPFDPWFVKWKVVGALTFPLRFTMTGAEMMRNYLLLKNIKNKKRININKKIDAPHVPDKEDGAREDDDAKRLEEIKKRRSATGK